MYCHRPQINFVKKIFATIAVIIVTWSAHAQKRVTIIGNISGLADSKVYLGNKPNGITKGFTYRIFDSVYSKNGVFEFRNFQFNEIAFYSIQFEGSQMWLSFLIDTGHIYIAGNKDSIYKAKVIGSTENDLYHLYNKEFANYYNKEVQSNIDSLDKYRSKDTFLYHHFLEINKQLAQRFLQKQKSFIRQFPGHYASLVVLHNIQKILAQDSLKYYFNLLTKNVRDNSRAAGIKYKVGNFYKNIEAGSIVPDFKFYDKDGHEVNLYSIDAPLKLIVFWASWCAPCIEEIPQLRALYTEHNNIAIISYSIDADKNSWINAIEKNQIPWYSYIDPHGVEGEFPAYFSVQQIPLMVLLDGENKIIKYDIRLEDLKCLNKSQGSK